jgi:transcriptional regulator with PAS, ATPase and Fis domain
VPGLVAIFADQRPAQRVFRLDQPIELGRADFAEEDAREQLISRRHVRVAWDAGELRVRDLDSRNGSFFAGQRIAGEASLPPGATLRLGGVLLLASSDVLPFLSEGLGVRDGIACGPIVCGPALRQALDSIALTRRMDLMPSLLLAGETGSGKEIAAQVFHAAAPAPGGPFVAVNCATLPKELAERLLFGSRRGAFSGATDAPGHLQAAHGGTLFLDEIAELPLEVQSKLLRVLETREVLRLGSTRPEPVDLRICAATWRDLRAEVAAGRFREDLFFRIGQPEVRLPPLRERLDELPWHVQAVLDSCAPAGRLRASVTFVEACAQRPWPGNVRELRAEVRRAAAAALARGAEALAASDLAPRAGQPLRTESAPGQVPATAAAGPAVPRDEFAEALRAEKGNVVRAAKRLGVDRNRVRRWLDRHALGAEQFKH